MGKLKLGAEAAGYFFGKNKWQKNQQQFARLGLRNSNRGLFAVASAVLGSALSCAISGFAESVSANWLTMELSQE